MPLGGRVMRNHFLLRSSLIMNNAVSNRLKNTTQLLWADYSAVFALVAVVIIAMFASGQFASSRNLLSIERQVSVIGIIALGLRLVIIVGGIDLSVGAVLALSGGAEFWALGLGDQPWLAVVTGLAVVLTCGALNGAMATWGKIPSFIATLGMLAGARSLILFTADGGSVSNASEAYGAIANSSMFGNCHTDSAFCGNCCSAASGHDAHGFWPLRVCSGQQRARCPAFGLPSSAGKVCDVYTLWRIGCIGCGN